MDPAVRVELPTDIAAMLLADEDAVPPFDTRNGGVSEIVKILLDGVSTGADLVTLIVSVNACRKIAKRYWQKILESGRPRVTIEITRSGGNSPAKLKIPIDDAAAEDKLLEFLVQSFKQVV